MRSREYLLGVGTVTFLGVVWAAGLLAGWQERTGGQAPHRMRAEAMGPVAARLLVGGGGLRVADTSGPATAPGPGDATQAVA